MTTDAAAWATARRYEPRRRTGDPPSVPLQSRGFRGAEPPSVPRRRQGEGVAGRGSASGVSRVTWSGPGVPGRWTMGRAGSAEAFVTAGRDPAAGLGELGDEIEAAGHQRPGREIRPPRGSVPRARLPGPGRCAAVEHRRPGPRVPRRCPSTYGRGSGQSPVFLPRVQDPAPHLSTGHGGQSRDPGSLFAEAQVSAKAPQQPPHPPPSTAASAYAAPGDVGRARPPRRPGRPTDPRSPAP